MKLKTKKSTYSEHLFQYRSVEKRKLIISLTITVTVMILEILGGIITNSIALISDAGHMFTHAFAISISLLAIFIARKPPCHHKTFGLYRAEVLAAFINGLFLNFFALSVLFIGLLIDRSERHLEQVGVAIINVDIGFLGLPVFQGNSTLLVS